MRFPFPAPCRHAHLPHQLLLPVVALAMLSCNADPVGPPAASTLTVLGIQVLQDGLLLDDRIVVRVGDVVEEFEPGSSRTNFVVPSGASLIAIEDLASNCRLTNPDVLNVTATPDGWNPIDLWVRCELGDELRGAVTAWVQGTELRFLDSEGVHTWPGSLRPIGSPSWAPDGERMALLIEGSTSSDKVVIIGSEGATLHTVSLDARTVSWAPDRDAIALLAPSTSCPDEMGLWIAEGPDWGSREIAVPCGLFGGGNALAWSPDGERVAVPNSVSAVMLITVENGQIDPLVFEDYRDWIDGLAWSPDGDKLLVASSYWDWFGGWDLGERSINSFDLNSRELSYLGTWYAAESGLALLPDGSGFLVESQGNGWCPTIAVVAMDGTTNRPLLPCGAPVKGIAVSPQQQRLP